MTMMAAKLLTDWLPARVKYALIVLAGGVAWPPVVSSADGPVRLFGVDYVDVADFGQRFGLAAKATKPGEVIRLQSKWTSITFEEHSMETVLNGTPIALAEPVVVQGDRFFLSRDDAENTLGPLLSPRRPRGLTVPKIIAIDAGHGGADPGNQNLSRHLREKTFTLDVARRLERLLKQDGYRVVMTRTSDRSVELEDRTAVANRAGADLFISIHFNSFGQRSVEGTETYVLTPFGQRSSPQRERDESMAETRYPGNQYDRWNVVLGYHLHRQLAGRLKPVNRGLKHFRYSVLRSVECPAVLVEAGFLSHEREAIKIATPAYRQQLAAAIAAGVEAYVAAIVRSKAAGS